MTDIERVSDDHRLLVIRTQIRVRSAQEVQALVLEHLSLTYGLKQGDTIDDDGRIVRSAQPPAAVPE